MHYQIVHTAVQLSVALVCGSVALDSHLTKATTRVTGILVISFIVFSIWFLKVMFKFLKKALSFFGKRKDDAQETGG